MRENGRGLIRPCLAQLQSARVELAGATRFERFLARARNPHAAAPRAVAIWPAGPGLPADGGHRRPRDLRKASKAIHASCEQRSR